MAGNVCRIPVMGYRASGKTAIASQFALHQAGSDVHVPTKKTQLMYGHTQMGKDEYLVEVEDCIASNDSEVASQIDKFLFSDAVQSELEPPMEHYNVLIPKGTKPGAPFHGKVMGIACTLLCPQEDELGEDFVTDLLEKDKFWKLPVPLDVRDQMAITNPIERPRGREGLIIVFDLTDLRTLEEARMLLHQCRKRTEAIKYSHEGEVRVPGYFSEEAGIIKGAKAPDGSEKPTFKGLGPEDDADPAAQRALSRMWLPIVLVGNKSDQKTARKVQEKDVLNLIDDFACAPCKQTLPPGCCCHNNIFYLESSAMLNELGWIRSLERDILDDKKMNEVQQPVDTGQSSHGSKFGLSQIFTTIIWAQRANVPAPPSLSQDEQYQVDEGEEPDMEEEMTSHQSRCTVQ